MFNHIISGQQLTESTNNKDGLPIMDCIHDEASREQRKSKPTENQAVFNYILILPVELSCLVPFGGTFLYYSVRWNFLGLFRAVKLSCFFRPVEIS